MGRMKDMKIDVEELLLNTYRTYEQIAEYLNLSYGISDEFAMQIVQVVAEEMNRQDRADEFQMELYFGA